MPRGKRPMAWMKLHGSFLDSSINYEMTLEEQCIFLKLCLFSLRCGMEPGVIADNDGKPIPEWYIANCIHASQDIVQDTVRKGKTTNRINENGKGCLIIVNWKYYQSEYDRQKPYRDQKKQQATLEEYAELITDMPDQSDLQAQKTWAATLTVLKQKLNQSNYITWLSKTCGLRYKKNELIIGVPSIYVMEYLIKNQHSMIEGAVCGVTDKPTKILYALMSRKMTKNKDKGE